MNDKYRLTDLSNATGQKLEEFISQNSRVIGEVRQHLENLDKLGGTSKAHAMGYQFYLEDEVNIEDFSNHLSKKGYDISMESLANVLLVAASAAIVAGVGYLAYKMIKASMNKKPKSVEVAAKLKEVQRVCAILGNVDLTALPESFQKLFLSQIADDVIPAARDGMSDADILHGAFGAYLRNEMASSGVTNYTLSLVGKQESDYLFFGAGQYIQSVKTVLEAFRGEFLDTLSSRPELFQVESGETALSNFKTSRIADSVRSASGQGTFTELMQFAGENGWQRHEVMLAPAVDRVRKWAKTFGVLPSEQASIEQIMEIAANTLFAPSGDDKLRKFSSQTATFPSAPSSAEYDRFHAGFAEFKKLGEKIKQSGDRFRRSGKISGGAAAMFEDQIRHATELFDSAVMLESGVRREIDSVARFTVAVGKAAKSHYNGLIAAAEKIEDEEERKKTIFEIKDTAKVAEGIVRKMALEVLEDDKPTLGEIMVIEGRNGFLDVLKVMGVMILLGAAVSVLGAALMSMMGVASFAAAWKGGLNWYDKNGKRITGPEAGKLVAEKARARKLNAYGTEAITQTGRPPIFINDGMVNGIYNTVANSIKDALSTFGAMIKPDGDKEHVSISVITASNAAIDKLKPATQRLMSEFKSMGQTMDSINPSEPTGLVYLREGVRSFETKWFSADYDDYNKIERGDFTKNMMQSFSDDAPEKLERHAENIAASIKSFGSRVRAVDKETLQGLSKEAQDAHERFINTLAFVSGGTGAMTKILKEAMRSVIVGVSCMRDSLKMAGESADSSLASASMDMQDYSDPILDVMASVVDSKEIDSSDYVEMVQENWGQVAKTGLIIVGALALLGAGAMILKSMLSRKSPAQAKAEHFDKIAKGAAASSLMDQLAANMSASINAMQQGFAEATNGPAVEVVDRKINPAGGSNSAAITAPEAGAAPKAKAELVDIGRAYAEIEDVIRERPYVKRIKDELTGRKAGRVLWGMVMHGPKVSFQSLDEMNSDESVKEAVRLIDSAVEDIINPVMRAVRAGNPNEEAERIYDNVVGAIESFTNSEVVSKAEVGSAEAITMLSEVMAYPDNTEQESILKMFNPEGMKNADVSYQAAYKKNVVILDKVAEVVELAERRAMPDTDAAIAKLRGNRDKMSSLLRRIDEFKPVFAATVRFVRDTHTLQNAFLSTVLESLKVHRAVQKDYATMVHEMGALAARAKLILEESDAASTQIAKDVDKMLEEQKKVSDIFKEAGL